MKRILKGCLCFLLCIVMLMPCISLSSFAAKKQVATVSGLKATSKSAESITLSWKKVGGAAGYQIYLLSRNAGKWTFEGSTSKNGFTDKKLSPGKVYTYKVRAYSKSGKDTQYGSFSAQLSALTAPKTPGSLKIGTVTGDVISLSWKKAAGAAGYNVYQRADGVKSFKKVAYVSSAAYTAKNLVSMTEYEFYVKAVRKSGKLQTKSAKSKTVKAKTKLGTVKSISVTGSGNNLTVSWSAVRGAEKYRVYIYDDTSKKWIGLSKQKEIYLVFDSVEQSADIKIRFRAYGKKLTSAASKTFNLRAVPAAPSNLKAATSSDNGIALSWSAVKGASGYEIDRYNASNGKWQKVGVSGKTGFVDRNLAQSSVYTYRVCAYKVSGNNVIYGEYSPSVQHEYRSTREPKSIYSKELEKSGIIGYLYDPKRNVFYTAADPWQRNFGFNLLYDTVAPFTLINYSTVRFKFRADDKDWMIQAWKGQYGLVFYGGEVGVYTKPTDRNAEHYDCASDSDMLKMAMVFYKKNTVNGKWVKRFERPYGTYWWCTGFKPGNNGYNFSVYRMDVRITMKSFEMLEGMKKALDKQKIIYFTRGLDMFFTY